MTEIVTEPKFAIGQRALLVGTPQGNVLWDRREWFLWLIDHTRAFRTTRRPPRYLSKVKVIPNDWYANSLETLTAENLQFLNDYLNRSQINALQTRAEKLLKNR